jgi:RNA polymerase sigma-70 factor (ECF subfamily)
MLSIEDHEIDIQEEQIKEIPFEVLSYKIDMIRKSIFALPDKYRIVLSLFLLEGYDHEEISQILNISCNAARTRYSRARGKLLKNLKDEKINQIV